MLTGLSLRPAALAAVILMSAVAVSGCTTDQRSADLQTAYDQYLAAVATARSTGDTAALPQVAVSPRLDQVTASITASAASGRTQESRVETVRVLRFTNAEALAEITLSFRSTAPSGIQGHQEQESAERWLWRTEKVAFVKDDGKWKVKETQFLRWSG